MTSGDRFDRAMEALRRFRELAEELPRNQGLVETSIRALDAAAAKGDPSEIETARLAATAFFEKQCDLMIEARAVERLAKEASDGI